MRPSFHRTTVLALVVVSPLALAASPAGPGAFAGAFAQEPPSDSGGLIVQVEPASLELQVESEASLRAEVLDADGQKVERPLLFFSLARRALAVSEEGRVTALQPGEFEVAVISPDPAGGGPPLRATVPVTVRYPPAARIELSGPGDRLYAGTTVRLRPRILTAEGLERRDLTAELTSSDPEVLSLDPFGWATAGRPGPVTLTLRGGGVSREVPLRVVENPVRTLEIEPDRREVRTGDVVRFRSRALDAEGRPVQDAPVSFAVLEHPVDSLLAPPAAAHIDEQGVFVAEKPGIYTVLASSGPAVARVNVRAEWRDVEQPVEFVGRGTVGHVHTSDLWVWEAADGRDYAITGSWGGDGVTYFWDVTDPADIVRVDSVQVDARTVNDVKVSEDGRICVISREGASSRRNGIVILDCTDPTDVSILARYDEGLTGGVHNLFIYEDHVYAVNNGRRYDIINIEDPRNPHRVGRFELDTPNRAIHDVWIVDGIAYSSNWHDGVVLVDVGNGIRGGSPTNPVFISSYAYPSGANHAAFPYRDEETGTFYVVAGDEIMPECADPDKPCVTQGYIHFIDFTDLENPREVARYQVPEAGTHNLWVEGDTLYVAYYNGGLRVVDISGELRGDLYRQGREIARFNSWADDGFVPNAPMAWGPQPYKGHIFFSDFNSGLWAVRLATEAEPEG